MIRPWRRRTMPRKRGRGQEAEGGGSRFEIEDRLPIPRPFIRKAKVVRGVMPALFDEDVEPPPIRRLGVAHPGGRRLAGSARSAVRRVGRALAEGSRGEVGEHGGAGCRRSATAAP